MSDERSLANIVTHPPLQAGKIKPRPRAAIARLFCSQHLNIRLGVKTKFCEVFTILDEDPYYSCCLVEKLKKTLHVRTMAQVHYITHVGPYHTSPASTNTHLLIHKIEVTDSPRGEHLFSILS